MPDILRARNILAIHMESARRRASLHCEFLLQVLRGRDNMDVKRCMHWQLKKYRNAYGRIWEEELFACAGLLVCFKFYSQKI